MILKERLIVVLAAVVMTSVLFLLTPAYMQRAESLHQAEHLKASCEEENAQNEKLREENQRLREELGERIRPERRK